jgi:acyl-CoA thioester hydrolase
LNHEQDQRDLRPGDFPVTRLVSTRWGDNDSYGHLNNAVHYQLFDSVINAWIAESQPRSRDELGVIGVVAESGCTYYDELHYPDDVLVGLRVERLGASSVAYGLGLFARPHGSSAGAEGPLAAKGRWVHVYVDVGSRRPAPIPPSLRDLFASAEVDRSPR